MASPIGSKRKLRKGLWQVPPTAKVLTQAHRDAARQDHTFAEELRKQTQYPERIDALIAGCTWFAGKACVKCGSVKRRVRDCACWSCKLARRPIALDHQNRLAQGWSSIRSRDGHLAILTEKRREKAGEFLLFEAPGITARAYPTGRLHVAIPSISIDSRDFREVPMANVFRFAQQFPALVDCLRWAGWSVD